MENKWKEMVVHYFKAPHRKLAEPSVWSLSVDSPDTKQSCQIIQPEIRYFPDYFSA
jgi:hypothetical protein